MQRPQTVHELEELGRVRLSRTFFLRDFLNSEIGNFHRIPNIPEDPDIAIAAGRRLCNDVLEPLRATFGGLAVRSGYRSPELNEFGHRNDLGCASNAENYGRHIWDRRDERGCLGAMACIVVPWFLDRYERGADWRSLAWWIHAHLPYSTASFFPKLAAFNISWSERPKRIIGSRIEPVGVLTKPGWPNHDEDHSDWYQDFPPPSFPEPMY